MKFSYLALIVVSLMSSSSSSTTTTTAFVVGNVPIGPKATTSSSSSSSSSSSPFTSSTSLFATTTTQVVRNPNFSKLAGGYLFPEIARRRNLYLQEHPEIAPSSIISLGIGDTTMPIPPHINQGLIDGASKLGTTEGYSGYGAEQGMTKLRERIATTLYGPGQVQPDEVFVSDGAKCDIMRLQQVFGSQVITAVQDPSYPVYVDTSVMMGQTGHQNPETKQYENIIYMPCTAENGFFPDYASLPRADIVYLCSPK
jgi:LL-diaminopimelate aminotransferase